MFVRKVIHSCWAIATTPTVQLQSVFLWPQGKRLRKGLYVATSWTGSFQWLLNSQWFYLLYWQVQNCIWQMSPSVLSEITATEADCPFSPNAAAFSLNGQTMQKVKVRPKEQVKLSSDKRCVLTRTCELYPLSANLLVLLYYCYLKESRNHTLLPRPLFQFWSKTGLLSDFNLRQRPTDRRTHPLIEMRECI